MTTADQNANNQIQAQENGFKEIPNHYLTEFGANNTLYQNRLINQFKDILTNQKGKRIIVLYSHPGAGKSRILKRIETDRDLLGSDYIPVYIDSRKFTGQKVDDLLTSLHIKIVNKLRSFGYNIPAIDVFNKMREKTTVTDVLISVDAHLQPNQNFLLILDEFDKLIDNPISLDAISSLGRFIAFIKRSWDQYTLVIAGDRKLPLIFADPNKTPQLANSVEIDIDDTLDENTLKELIVNPVKNELTYAPDAVDSIIKQCGRNYYFQQILCHYLVKDLNQKQKNTCRILDIEPVVDHIAEQKIPELVFAWNHILDHNARLISSALMDDRVVEKIGDTYHIKENTLLDDLFGDSLESTAKQLQVLGFINKMEKRRFDKFPLQIPLYGMWIKKQHPFLKTILENLEPFASKLELKKITQAIKEAPQEILHPFDKNRILETSKYWITLKDTILRGAKIDFNEVEKFLCAFCTRLNLDAEIEQQTGESYFKVNIKSFKIGLIKEAIFFLQESRSLTDNDISRIETKATEYAHKTRNALTLFIYFEKSGKIEELSKNPLLNLIPIDESVVSKIILSSDAEEVFKKLVINRVSLQKISPYTVASPVKITFYGRKNYLDRIINAEDVSFSIVGTRRIGKSSLLNRVKDMYRPGITCIYMDVDSAFLKVKTYGKFLQNMESELKNAFGQKIKITRFPHFNNIHRLRAVIEELYNKGKRILFLFDEIDGLLAFDKKHNYKLTRVFRALSQKKVCQFVFSGFKELFHRKRESDNPLYNFYEEIVLKPLERDEALELITKPMESIGVHYQNESDRELILGYTACHPNLLQFFCKQLIERIEQHPDIQDRRIINKEDIETVFNETYEEYILDQVYMFYYLEEISRLILILICEKDTKESFSEEEIRDKLLQYEIDISREALHKHLKNLVMHFILLYEGKDMYKLALSVLPEILNKRIDGYYKQKIVKEIQKNGSKSF